jgi:SAM-dependent methyltransferase
MGFVYTRDGDLLRQVNRAFADEWDAFEGSPLQRQLIDEEMLVAHETVDTGLAYTGDAHKVIRPTRIPFISYPYEWSFGQLKDAALLTLRLQRIALRSGYTLRDASAYNVQFLRGRPILIDSLSFERHTQGGPWRAYRQFCEHFLGPLALMSYRDVRLRTATAQFLDGVPIDLTATLLPRRARLRLGLGAHVFLHARAHRSARSTTSEPSGRRPRPVNLERLTESLEGTVRGLRWEPGGTQWVDYDERGSYSAEGLASKDRIVTGLLSGRAPSKIWDLGANAGRYSAIAAELGHEVVAIDADPGSVERIYRRVRDGAEGRIHPLVIDLTNPSPSLGWASEERKSLTARADAHVLMAYALVHHLALAAGTPLVRIARWLALLGPELVIEFVPPDDPMAAALLAARQGETQRYDRVAFVQAFEEHWQIDREIPIEDSGRSIFTMQRRS